MQFEFPSVYLSNSYFMSCLKSMHKKESSEDVCRINLLKLIPLQGVKVQEKEFASANLLLIPK